MLLDPWFVAGLAGLVVTPVASAAACTSNLVIDNFTKWTSGVNNLDWVNGDDGSMSMIAASGGNVIFVPKDGNSYFYESFECLPAVTNGYGGIQFTVQGPAGSSFALELQSTTNCATAEGGDRRSSYTVVTDLTGRRQTVTLPLIGFDGNPNYDAITGLVWAVFSQPGVQWSVGNIELVCGSVNAAPSSSATVPTRSVITSTATRSTIAPPVTTTTSRPGVCSNLLIDDWESQSRLTFLGYNALGQASSDDGTMKDVLVSGRRLLLTPRDAESYFYSQLGCLNVQNTHGGISMRIRAARGTSFAVTLAWYQTCGSNNIKSVTLTTAQLKWTFDGTERLYWFPFSVFTGVDATKLQMLYFSNFNAAAIFGPMSFYCGTTATDYVIPAASATSSAITKATTATPNTSGGAKTLLIDTFSSQTENSLGEWHGGDDGMAATFGNNVMTIRANDSDMSWNTQLANKCADMRSYAGSYLHIAYSGSNKFSVALQQHNSQCNDSIAPYPETWDSVEAARYSSKSDIYIPISHFSVNLQRIIGVNLRGFYTQDETRISRIEIVDKLPSGWGQVPPKLASGKLVFACTRPNSFAFAIDDGDPKYLKRVMDILRAADIPLTFFTVGLPLLDTQNGLAAAYKDMAARGHQIALHSYTHPKMEGLPDTASIDWEYNNDIGAVKQVFGTQSVSPYFRPPFGTEGARMRQRLAATLNEPNPYIVGWSIDVEDWLWADTNTPERQLTAFRRDIAKGGNLMVMHYLHNSTVEYLPEFIRLAKATGKRLMRVDQCMEDPKAPPLK